jgi:hypothetical protein
MSFQVGRGCLPLVITRQRLSDTRRHLSVQFGPSRWHESACWLLSFAGRTKADRAGFRHVFSDPHCLFSRYQYSQAREPDQLLNSIWQITNELFAIGLEDQLACGKILWRRPLRGTADGVLAQTTSSPKLPLLKLQKSLI